MNGSRVIYRTRVNEYVGQESYRTMYYNSMIIRCTSMSLRSALILDCRIVEQSNYALANSRAPDANLASRVHCIIKRRDVLKVKSLYSTVHLLETQVWMRKIFSAPTDPYINRSVSRSAFYCTFNFLQQSSFRLFIARSLLSPVPLNPTQALK
eukprot:COSAG02_NODE_4002_length_5929_cov_5.601201_3_plen_153_part_00